MELADLEQGVKLCASGGAVLNCQELTGLQSGLNVLQQQEKFSKVYFWGKVFGLSGDYYVACGLLEPEFEFPEKVFHYASEDLTFQPLPKLTAEEVDKLLALRLEKPFSGKPDVVIEPSAEGEEPPAEDDGGNEGDASKPKKLTEAHWLAHAVSQIDFDTALVPKGAYMMNDNHVIVPARDFKGLSLTEAMCLSNYVHFRPPTSIAGQRALARKDAAFVTNVMDPCEKDLPKGCWSVRQDPSVTVVTLRSLIWQGYTAYSLLGCPKFGGVYFGYGQRCKELPFLV